MRIAKESISKNNKIPIFLLLFHLGHTSSQTLNFEWCELAQTEKKK